MSPEYFIRVALNPALALLPAKMDSVPARAMCVAACLQESALIYRRQVGGPAHGYGQFEQGGGVRGVLTHAATKPHIQKVLIALDYDPESDPAECYAAIEHNDILLSAFVRLNLWWLPGALPGKGQTQLGWEQYFEAWRPGKPKRKTWDAYFNAAWQVVERQ